MNDMEERKASSFLVQPKALQELVQVQHAIIPFLKHFNTRARVFSNYGNAKTILFSFI